MKMLYEWYRKPSKSTVNPQKQVTLFMKCCMNGTVKPQKQVTFIMNGTGTVKWPSFNF